jgi:hypothetical protein
MWETERPGSTYYPPPPATFLGRVGLYLTAYSEGHDSGGHSRYALTVPYWLMVAATAASPVTFLISRRRRRRAQLAGLCLWCGYDLRATPDRCPECGAVPTTFSV